MSTVQKDQIDLLSGHFKRSGDPKIVKRSQAIILHLKGWVIKDVAEACLQKERTIYRWVQRFKQNGIGSIFPGYYQNQNAAKLTRKQKQEIKRLLGEDPLPNHFWNLGNLKKYISARFDIEYESKQSYYGLLQLCNYSYKLPSLFNIRRDDDFVKERIDEIRNEIKPYLKNPDYLVFTSDETRLEWNTLLRRAWLKKGKKTVIKEKRERKYQNFIGFLNLKSKEDLLYRLEWQDQKNIIPVLADLTNKYPKKKIIIIWDNAGFHRGSKTRELLGKNKPLQNIKLIWLPPYAPDKNPQELVWRYAKDQISNAVFNQFENLLNTFEVSITGRKFNYKF